MNLLLCQKLVQVQRILFHLSTKISIVRNLFLSWINHFVTSLPLKMNIGCLSLPQSRSSTTHRYKQHFFSARVFQVYVSTVKITCEQWSKLQFTEDLTFHSFYRSYNVPDFFGHKGKTAEQWNFCVANKLLLNKVSVYHEKLYADSFLTKNWILRFFSSQ